MIIMRAQERLNLPYANYYHGSSGMSNNRMNNIRQKYKPMYTTPGPYTKHLQSFGATYLPRQAGWTMLFKFFAQEHILRCAKRCLPRRTNIPVMDHLHAT